MGGFEVSLWHEEWLGGTGTNRLPVKDNEVVFPPDPSGQALARALIEAVYSITPSPSFCYEPAQCEAAIASWPGAMITIFKREEETPFVLRVEKAAIALRSQELGGFLAYLAEYFELVGVLRFPT